MPLSNQLMNVLNVLLVSYKSDFKFWIGGPAVLKCIKLHKFPTIQFNTARPPNLFE